jgi:hypothetical protein
MTAAATCKHQDVSCINHYEWIRKYRCKDCGEVMLCACDEKFGKRCLPHQIERAQDYGTTHQFTPVTLGFVRGVCNACRGVVEEPHPMAQSYGCSSKIPRFYWRELARETLSRFDMWAKSQGFAGWMQAASKHAQMRKEIEREVLAEIKKQHEKVPKYSFKEDSQDDIIRQYKVETVALHGVHISEPNGLKILDGVEPCDPEEFAARHFRSRGYDTLFLESRPFHVLFSVFLWMLIEDPDDPFAGPSGFGDRNAFDKKEKGPMVWITLPTDFGSAAYATRRAGAIDEHLDFIICGKDQLRSIFDYWLEPSERLRQYLWAHRPEDVERARILLDVLSPDLVISLLRFLVGDYWGRYLGWPDLLCYRGTDFVLAEVKSSKDKLSQPQKEWIRLNAENLRLPFRLVKIHR